MDDRAHRRLRRVADRDRRAKRDGDSWRLYGTKWFTSATTSEMALTLARPEGNPDGSRGLALFFVELRDAQRPAAQHPRQPPQGQARHAQGADRRAHARRHAGDAGRRAERRRPPDHADARRSRARGTRSARRRGDAPRPRARPRLRAPAHGVRRAARRQAAPRRHARRARGRVRGRVLPRVPRARAARRARARRADEVASGSSRALVPIAKLTTAKQAVAVDVGGDRGVRRRRLRRGHRPAAHPRRRAGAADLGGHDERAVARHAARARQGRRARGDRREIERSVAARDDPASPPVEAARAAFAHATAWVARRDAAAGPARGRRAPVRDDARPQRSSSRCSSRTRSGAAGANHPHAARLAAAVRRFAANGVDVIADASLADTKLLVS